MEQKNINVSISDGDPFFCHEISLNFNPLQFIFDFKTVTPRVDMRSKQGPVVQIKHNVVMMDPYHTKMMLDLMSKVVSDYEKEFGKIKKPKSVEKMEQKMDKKKKTAAKSGTAAKHKKSVEKTIKAPSYFG